MICTHDNCFTCPYSDCISDVEVEPDRKKRGRKKLPLEEKKKRIAARNHDYYMKHRADFEKAYKEKSEGKVKRRYRSKCKDLAQKTSVNV